MINILIMSRQQHLEPVFAARRRRQRWPWWPIRVWWQVDRSAVPSGYDVLVAGIGRTAMKRRIPTPGGGRNRGAAPRSGADPCRTTAGSRSKLTELLRRFLCRGPGEPFRGGPDPSRKKFHPGVDGRGEARYIQGRSRTEQEVFRQKSTAHSEQRRGGGRPPVWFLTDPNGKDRPPAPLRVARGSS